MVENHTFYFHYWSLMVSLVIIQGYINLWHTPDHIIDCGSFLNVINFLTVLLSVWTISQEMLFSATPTFQKFSLWVISLHWYRSRSFILVPRRKILLEYTPGWEVHSGILFVVFKSWGFAPLFLKSRTTLLFPVSTRLCLMSILFMTICCLSNSVF